MNVWVDEQLALMRHRELLREAEHYWRVRAVTGRRTTPRAPTLQIVLLVVLTLLLALLVAPAQAPIVVGA